MVKRKIEYFKLVDQLDFADILLSKDKAVLIVRYKEGTEVDIKKGRKLIDTVYPYHKNNIPFGLTDATAAHISFTNEARKLYSNNKSLELSKAQAVVVSHLPIRLMANFFILFDKPIRPVRSFNSFDLAFEWLDSFDI